jgi:hypothetical protein
VLLALAGNPLSCQLLSLSTSFSRLPAVVGFVLNRVLPVARISVVMAKRTGRLRGPICASLGSPVFPHQPKFCGQTLQLTRPSLSDGTTRLRSFLKRISFWIRIAGDTLIREVLVKFAAKSKEAAHRLLTNRDPPLAQFLHSCTRVIDDIITAQCNPSRSPRAGVFPTTQLRSILQGCLRGFTPWLCHVFGHLRDANLL